MVNELRAVIDKIKSEKGPIALFLLLKNNPAIDDWSIMFSASWIASSNTQEAFGYLSALLKERLSVEDLKKISRLGLLPSDNEFVLAINQGMSISDNSTDIKSCQFGNFLIEEGVLFESNFTPSTGDYIDLNDVPISSVVTTKNGSLYWYAKDKKRYVFPNIQTFETWFPKTAEQPTIYKVKPEQLVSLLIGGNVTYRPGVKLIKLKTDPKIYAVSIGGYARWIPDQKIIEAIYGSSWQDKIDEIPDAFFVNYSFKSEIKTPSDYNPEEEMRKARTVDDTLFTERTRKDI